MTLPEFNARYAEIVNAISNTNYGYINGQLKLILLFQEVATVTALTKDEIIRLAENFPYQEIRNRAQDAVLGKIIDNLNGFHSCTTLFDDFGEAYTAYLFSKLNTLHFSENLFDRFEGEE